MFNMPVPMSVSQKHFFPFDFDSFEFSLGTFLKIAKHRIQTHTPDKERKKNRNSQINENERKEKLAMTPNDTKKTLQR